MPRTGVRYDDVVESIHTLEKAGLNASIRNIRERIGKGSLTTIAEHKREYELATASTPREALPDAIAKGLMKGAETYWQELVEAAEAEIIKVQESANETVAELTSRVSELERDLADTQEALNGESVAKKAVEDTLAAAESTKIELKSQLQAQSTELAAVTARLDESRQAAEKADADRDQLTQQLKASQTEVAKLLERHDNAASKYATELARLKTDLAEAMATGEALSEKLEAATETADKAGLDAREQAARTKVAEIEATSLKAEVSRLQAGIEKQRTNDADARSALEAQLARQTALVDEKDARIGDLHRANKALEQALKSRRKPKKTKHPTKLASDKR